jgi:ABC-type glutathione transport system ATPase component
MTLAELKVRFPQLTSEQIRSVLPPANARERKARTGKEAAKTARPVGGKRGDKVTVSEEKKVADPKPAPEPKYADNVDDLSAQVLAARERVGRKALAEFAGQSQSAIWRWERSRVHATEVEAIQSLVKRIEAGELPVPEPKTPKAKALTKAELEHRIDEVVRYLRGGTSGSGKSVAQAVLAILDPAAEEATESQ